MRLDKYLAEAGKGTRSEVKKMISKGHILVNGTCVKDPGFQIRPQTDIVLLDGAAVRYAAFEYFMLNKPQGVISASWDEHPDTVCVTDLIRDKIRSDLFPVGRLDQDTEGLLLITNDGPLAHRLLSPAHHVEKTYLVHLDGVLTQEKAQRIMAGTDIGDKKPTLPCEIKHLSEDRCLITIREGRYHQIKRMFRTASLTVTYLKRLSMGPLSLDPALSPGEYRPLQPEELTALQSL